MSGEDDLFNKRLTTLENRLENFEEKLEIGPGSKFEQLTNLSLDDIQSLTLEQAGEAASYLAQMSLHIQKEFNHHKVIFDFCAGNLRILFGKECENYKGFAYWEKQDKVLTFDEYGSSIFRKQLNAQAAMNYLSYLPSKIEFYCKTLEQLQRSRSKYSEKFT